MSKKSSLSLVEGHENIVRYVGGSHVDPETKIVNGSAFDRLPKDKDGLSVMRTNVFSSEKLVDEDKMREVLASRRDLGKTAIFIEFNVDAMFDKLTEFQHDVAVVRNPLFKCGNELANPAHALILGLPFQGEKSASLKSEVVGDKLKQIICHTFPAYV